MNKEKEVIEKLVEDLNKSSTTTIIEIEQNQEEGTFNIKFYLKTKKEDEETKKLLDKIEGLKPEELIEGIANIINKDINNITNNNGLKTTIEIEREREITTAIATISEKQTTDTSSKQTTVIPSNKNSNKKLQ